MVEANRAGPVRLTAEEDAHLDLVASRHDLSSALARQIEFSVKQMGRTPEEAAAFVRSRDGIQPEDQDADQVSWFEIAHLLEADPERGERLWRRIKDDADRELTQGVRSSQTVEPKVGARPIHRARLSSVVKALSSSLAPRDPLELLLVHQMACAYELHLVWQERASDKAQQDEWEGERDRRNAVRNMNAAQRERYEGDHGWMPPRVGTADAIDQAVTIADRYQRSFLRLLKAFRDNRRLFGTLVVTGGQVNVGERQVNISADSDTSSG